MLAAVRYLEDDRAAFDDVVRRALARNPRDTELYDALNQLQGEALGEAVARLLAGDRGIGQDETLASYGCTRVPDDGELDWARDTLELDRLVRGLTPPAPGAFTYLGLQRLWVDDLVPR